MPRKNQLKLNENSLQPYIFGLFHFEIKEILLNFKSGRRDQNNAKNEQFPMLTITNLNNHNRNG